MRARNPAHENTTKDIGNGYTIERRLMGYSYPRNGNVHNATPRYMWLLRLEGVVVDRDSRYRVLRAAAKRDDYRMSGA